MEPERWRQIAKLFQSAIQRPPDERDSFLDGGCAGDAALRKDVESLIAAHDQAGTFMESPGRAIASFFADPPPAAIPESIGPYSQLALIGRGGMGEVYVGQDVRLGRRVALKLLRAEVTRDQDRLRRFQQEARAASALNHPNILTVYETGDVNGLHYIATEYVEGETLRRRIAGSPMAPGDALDVAIQVGSALSVAHQAGIVHRDIKPENIMLRPDGYAKVLDFGIAKFADQKDESSSSDIDHETRFQTHPGLLVGSPAYMSPEQTRGLAVDARTDIFSVGVVLYEMLAGSPPFSGSTMSDVLASILTMEPLPLDRCPTEIPEELQQVVTRALAKDREERFQTSADLVAALKSVKQELEFRAKLEGPRPATPSVAPAIAIATPVRHIVGRARERTQMQAGFDAAAASRGLLLCVSGDAGIGKTTLVEDFLDQLAGEGKAFCVARGRCSERLAGTEAYLPFLEALDSLLSGDEMGAASRAMKKVAPTWYVQITPPSADGSSAARLMEDVRTASQERMKRELGAFLHEMSQRQPLVLFLDDLHWADVSTVDLLAYLGTKLQSMRVLIVATYRTSDLLLSKHPFLNVKLDLQGRGVCRDIALDFLSRADVDRYLDLTFPGHRFPPDLPALIHTKTEGSPLFIVDLVGYLRDRGVIADDDGQARLAQSLPDVARELPESIRSMIERKIERLSAPDRRLLLAASVQGYEFDSAVLSTILEEDPADVEERLELLDRVHTFVRLTREEVFPDGTPTVRYRFVHVLYQNALYASLRPTRRVLLSKAVAEALLGHYQERSGEVAAELAHLFDTARDVERAVDFFLLAAQRAADVFAYEEATSLARRGLELVPSLPATPERAQKELLLNLTAGFSLSVIKGSATPEMGESMQRARAICEQMGDIPQLFPVIWGLWAYYVVGAELSEAREMAEKTLRLAEAVNDPVLLIGAHYAMGTTLRFLGQLHDARAHHEQAIALDNPQYYGTYSRLFKLNPRLHGQSELAHALWTLGYPDQARQRLDEALALARDDRDPRSLAHAQHFGAVVHQACGNAEKSRELADACFAHCNDHGIAQERDWVSIWRGWAISELESADEGITLILESLSTIRARRAEVVVAFCVLPLADALIKNGRIDDGLGVIEEALSLVRSNGERSHEPELHRLKADLLLMRGDDTLHGEAEACFEKAIESARSQTAKSFELRAVMGLCRLRQRQGRAEEARHMLSEIYGWFTEGFETRDLQQARDLLQSLAKPG